MLVEPVSRDRAMTRDILRVGSSRHVIHGLVEADVGEAKRRIGDLSFTAFLIHCFATAVAAEPSLNGVQRRRRFYSFLTVNVGTMLEREEAGRKRVAGVVIEDAAAKTVAAISSEIREAQRRPVSELMRQAGALRFLWLPGIMRRAALRIMLSRPRLAHRLGLITGVTAVGMFGTGPGWGIPITPCLVALTVGGIGRRVVLVHDRPEEHPFLCLTLSFNHDVVDGAPAARFAGRLTSLIEAADGLGPGNDEHIAASRDRVATAAGPASNSDGGG